MSWNGYLSQLYDGQLCLYMVNNNSYIKGHDKGTAFYFDGVKLITGKWPEFLCLYEPKKIKYIIYYIFNPNENQIILFIQPNSMSIITMCCCYL